MDSILPVFIKLVNTYAGNWLHIGGESDLLMYGVGIAIVVAVVTSVAFYSVKKIGFNLITGYVVLYIAQNVFNIAIVPDSIMLTLMALFGPLAVIVAVLWHVFL